MVGHKRERVLGRVGRAVNAAARDFAREGRRSLRTAGGRDAAAERLVERQVEVVALDKLFCVTLVCVHLGGSKNKRLRFGG